MRILHVWDVAGVASVLAKWQQKDGHDVKVIMQTKWDTTHISAFYYGTHDMGKVQFVRHVLNTAKDYDVIHVHNISEILPLLKLRYPKKKIIIHHHGFTSATKNIIKFTHLFADNVFVATHDLQDIFPKSHLIPTPVDIEHFHDNAEIGTGALSFTSRYLDIDKFHKHIEGVDVSVVDREKYPIAYADMPNFLREYDTYYDIKYIKQNGLLKAHSKTAFEALACGLQVIDFEGKVLKKFPEHHRPEYSARLCVRLYGEGQ